ncbi:MAG: hypothetical protein WED05_09130 [Candidatus Atabeyarchaeum deiterrae]
MSIKIQDLPDVVEIALLLNLEKDEAVPAAELKQRIDKICGENSCIDSRDFNKASDRMMSDRLITGRNGLVKLTKRGASLGRDWRNLLLKREPTLEVVAGLTDGSVTGLVVILSAFTASLAPSIAIFAALLTLSSVAITNFSSFLLGGITEDISDMITLESLLNHSLSDIPSIKERDKSLRLLKELFVLLHRQISRANIYAATLCCTTTLLAGFIPIVVYLTLPKPFNIVLSLCIVAVTVGFFLVHYRSKRTKVHWKVTLLETIVIILIAVFASLLLGAGGI